MRSKVICMNEACGTTTSVEWRKGWVLRSGGFATLCFNCGYAYENLVFCDKFHLEETGWRECSSCKKRLHCGCIASKSLFELLEFGGVRCTSCARSYMPQPIRRDEVPNRIDTSTLNNIVNTQSPLAGNQMDVDTFSKEKLLHLGNITETRESSHFTLPQKSDKNSSNGIAKREVVMHPIGELGASFLSLIQPSVVSSQFSKPNNSIPISGVKDMYESLCQPSLSISLSAPSGTPNFTPTFPSGVVEGREHNKAPSPFQQGQKSRPILPKPSKFSLNIGSDANKDIIPPVRVARPPAEGRGRNVLLPRYWPRITDQELQQLSGDLNSTIVPLFEKVLSASDAGRIGRLVLPKACAEAYFPPITHSEGLPIRIQDAKGKEWTFQFRFWPNNNSRMYVLEGVTPCIQSMQLQAGDTVIFSRIDPGGKLVIGSRKASGTIDMQDGEASALPNVALPGEMSLSGVPTISGYSGLFPSPKECMDPHLNTLCEHLNVLDEDVSWPKSEKLRGRPNENVVQRPMVVPEKKRTRNIGSKSKRLLMHNDDAMELRLTWEEAQDLLRPPPRVKPIIVTIEDHEFEEYDEPPVFGKRTLFTARPSGEQEQWAQCDNCCKWRRLPIDFLLPSKWTCSDNVWDPSRCSCSAPDEMSPKEVENLFKSTKDFKRRRTTESHKVVEEHEPSGLDALASAAVLGDSVSDPGDGSVGATTKHPRHRPGCTCIVCIQPPSGKGKHKPTCTCNVCMTVKRRFKTMMLRKKIRQSEREAEIAQKDHINLKDESEMNDPSRNELLSTNHSENEITQSIIQTEVGETSNGPIDLNCQPDQREDVQREATGMSMMSLVQVASFPLENYLKQNRIESLAYEQQTSLVSCSLPQDIQEGAECLPDEIENGRESAVWDRDNEGEERHCEPSSGKLD